MPSAAEEPSDLDAIAKDVAALKRDLAALMVALYRSLGHGADKGDARSEVSNLLGMEHTSTEPRASGSGFGF